jgi:hypothetical protein
MYRLSLLLPLALMAHTAAAQTGGDASAQSTTVNTPGHIVCW